MRWRCAAIGCWPDAIHLKIDLVALGMSARAFHRALKLGRTIADLAGSERIQPPHLSEALQYRPRRQE